MDWWKDAAAVIAQHGPWAVLAFYLAYKHIENSRIITEALTRTAVALEGLSLRYDRLVPKGGPDAG